jgi:5-methylcytosine-specific restriction endonuclease McrA
MFKPATLSQRYCSRSCSSSARYADQPKRANRWGPTAPLGSDHAKLRAEMLTAALGLPCVLGCGTVITRANAQLDHRVPRALGGQTSRQNCRIICAPCNHARGSSLGGQVAKARRRALTERKRS